MTDSLFTDVDQTIDPNKNYFTELVGDGKKFKTVEDLARGKYEADLFIATQNKRQDELRADYQRVMEENKAKARLEELIDKLSSNNQHQSSNDNTQVNDGSQSLFKPEQLDSMITSKFQEFEAKKKQDQNFDSVWGKAQERLGSNYKNVLKQQIDELGITEADFVDMARKTPKVLIKTLGLDAPIQREDDFQAPPRSNKRNDNFSPSTQKRDWTWYQNLKKSNPELYRSPKITNQMHQDYLSLGKDFESGDFNAI